MVSNEILLLKIIDSNGRISLLRDRGLSHSQVAMLIEKQQSEGNITISEDRICLTHKGKETLEQGLSKITHTQKDQWIVPKEHKFKDPIGIDMIVLPKKKKI